MSFHFSLRPAVLALLSLPVAAGAYFTSDAGAPPATDSGPVMYEVSITNLTRGQIMSPPVVATHSAGVDLWQLGAPASSELTMIAEDAVNQPMINLLSASSAVADVQVAMGAGGPILPGETAKVLVMSDPSQFGEISLVGMLVITNDAFFGLNGVALPASGTSSFRSPAYDAGSEANTEQCAHIPGPPCGNAMVRVNAGAEGYVHIHGGFHGLTDLVAAQFDWRNPVAAVSVRRL